MEKLLENRSLSTIGFLQAFGVAVYCVLVAGFFTLAEKIFPKPGFLAIVLLLVIFVFSAAITGSLVFGYPAYLALNRKIKEALQLLAFTLLYFLLIIILIVLLLGVYTSFTTG